MTDGPDDYAARAARVRKALQEAPTATVHVLVDALGASLGRSRGETDWSLSAGCPAWKAPAGDLRRSGLVLRCEGPVETLRPWQAFLAGNRCVRVKVRLVEETELGMPQAWLVKRRGESEDSDLIAIRDELTKPVVLEDPQFRNLTLDRALGSYGGSIEWLGQEVEFSVSPEELSDPKAALDVARSLVKDAQAWQPRIRDYAVERLLDLKNESWLGDDEQPVDAAEFQSRMTLESISVHEQGWSFWHKDGGLFAGHSILISGDLDGPSDADIPG